MFLQTCTYFPGEIEPLPVRVGVFEYGDNPEALHVVIEPLPVLTHAGIEGFFTRMPKRWMPEIVPEGNGFAQVFIETEVSGEVSRDLCDLERVSEAVTIMVACIWSDDLHLALQSAKGTTVDYAVTVTLKG